MGETAAVLRQVIHLRIEAMAVVAGALLSLMAAWLSPRFMQHDLFMAVTCGAWAGFGLLALVRGEVSLGGRRGPARTWRGRTARLIGTAITLVVAFTMWYWTVRSRA